MATACERDAFDAERSSIADDENIDTSWVDDFKTQELHYNHFYKEPITSIKLYVLYANKEKELIKIEKKRCLLDTKGWLHQDRLIAIIKDFKTHAGVQYKLHSLLRYNIDLSPDEVTDFINNTSMPSRFLTSEKYLTDLHYNDSIQMFQNLNALYFLYIAEATTTSPKAHHTKRITLTAKKHKTLRNRYNKNLKIKKK